MPFASNACFLDIDPTLPVVPAAPGYFRIAIYPFDPLKTEPFCPMLEPVVAWRIDYYAVPVTAEDSSDFPNYAILRLDGRVTHPFNGGFASLDDLVAKVNQEWDELRSAPSRIAASQRSAVDEAANSQLQKPNRSHVTDLSNSPTVKS
jgi:hypothetical protein